MSAQQVTAIFARIEMELNRVIEVLPTIVGNEAVNYSLEAFKNQAWEGAPWQKRKDKKDAARNLLVKSSRLRRSIRIIRTTADSVTIGSDVPYAAVHNNGGQINRAARSETFVRNRYTHGPKSKYFGGQGTFKKGTTKGKGLSFKAHSFNMPKRQFLGNTVAFERAMRKVVRDEFDKAIKHLK
ncbi:phage virion morphogenesis protein [Mucilaginibacter gossypii]|uniref:phage virion morphogenesis protein n=1 Tax=Mucilaginibacter gossypii TaxID=551996 RepID=UPI000DCE9B0D|nr:MULTISPECIES: phage virion morphogenesis protein [Mucilaginibacter]QTE36015.1 phage virion morphogenesis protein [Mucilaginibacter gossypii]RAV56688.1 hypothetical protein DIU36_14905 [Mucilaginibacter rubeus]